MHRRKFLAGVATSAGLAALTPGLRVAAATQSAGASHSVERVAVIGAGIVGAAIAWHLARRGCDVVVLEKNAPALQASGNSFAWLNASWVKLPHSYHLLSTYSLAAYRRLSVEVSLPIRWGGCLEWVADPAEQRQLEEGIRQLQRFGSPVRMIDAMAASNIEPNVTFDDHPIAFSPLDGALDGGGATLALLKDAAAKGAKLSFPLAVRGIERRNRSLRVHTEGDSVDVDAVVVAAGLGTTALARSIGLRLEQKPRPGIIVRTQPLSPIINGVVVAPGMHIHQLTDGRVVIGEQAGAPDTDEHRAYLEGRPNRHPTEDIANQHAQRILDIARQFVPQLGRAEVERVGIGWRPIPTDGLPVIGYSEEFPGVYFAVMHSGMTLGAIVGELAAMEILDGVEVDLLADFRLERLSN